MEKNISDNTLVFGSCHARSCIEVPSLKAGNAKWKALALEKFAHSILKGMKSLAHDMSQLVDKNFWHLV